MTTYNTTISKDYYGLTAKTEIDLNRTTEEGAMTLQITTSKRSNGRVSTHATVIYNKPDGSYSTIVFQDYSKTIAQIKLTRVTEKSLSEAHKAALAAIPAVMLEVAAQYNLNTIA